MRRTTLGFVTLSLACSAGAAVAFGTIGTAGQNYEHERITRHALACAYPQPHLPGELCFQPASMDEMAGKKLSKSELILKGVLGGTKWGAVGAPDNPARGLITSDAAHCDNGDYLNVPGYPNTKAKAQETLAACRTEMNSNMNKAVEAAKGLLDDNGKIRDSQIPTIVSCTYLGPVSSGRAKCNVLEYLGLVFHAAQDFYSHSNWVDQAAPGGISLTNPPGLNRRGRAAWLDLRRESAFPDGLITGCFDKTSIASPSLGCPGHVKHEDLNKDKGQIDNSIGLGTTPRGKINDNFKRAVEAAINDTTDKWLDFRQRLYDKYGSKAEKMVCAITRDDPVKAKSKGGCS